MMLGGLRHPNIVYVFGVVLPAEALPPSPDVSVSAGGGSSERCAPARGASLVLPCTISPVVLLKQHEHGVCLLALPRRHLSLDEIDAVCVSARAARQTGFVPGVVRPPALVSEFMPGGSVRGALDRRADFLAAPATRVKIALDAARGCAWPIAWAQHLLSSLCSGSRAGFRCLNVPAVGCPMPWPWVGSVPRC